MTKHRPNRHERARRACRVECLKKDRRRDERAAERRMREAAK